MATSRKTSIALLSEPTPFAIREERLRDCPALVVVNERQVGGLDPSSGFDDFLVAPYRPVELDARIRLTPTS